MGHSENLINTVAAFASVPSVATCILILSAHRRVPVISTNTITTVTSPPPPPPPPPEVPTSWFYTEILQCCCGYECGFFAMALVPDSRCGVKMQIHENANHEAKAHNVACTSTHPKNAEKHRTQRDGNNHVTRPSEAVAASYSKSLMPTRRNGRRLSVWDGPRVYIVYIYIKYVYMCTSALGDREQESERPPEDASRSGFVYFSIMPNNVMLVTSVGAHKSIICMVCSI